MKRRTFITLLGGAAIARPLSARAQQAGKIHKIGYLSPDSPSAVITPFSDALRELGWIEGQNVLTSSSDARTAAEVTIIAVIRSWIMAPA